MNLRRLLVLASAIVFVDTMFYAAVVPLLPSLADDYGLSKTEAGVLSGAYATGTLVAAIPGGWLAARVGARPTVLSGLSLMAASSVVFAYADSVLVLDAARFVQGVGGAASWAGALGWLISAAPSDRRGELIGTALAAAIAGVLLGPVLGGAAVELGRAEVFTAFAVLGLAMIAVATRVDAARPAERPSARMIARGLARPDVRLGMWLILIPAMLFGAVDVLVPLRLDELGAGATAIAGTFIVAAFVEAVVTPLAGRVSDRRGRMAPMLVGLAGSIAFVVTLGLPDEPWLLALLLIATVPWIGMLWSPAMAMLSDGAEAARVDQGLAFGFLNLGWALGHMIGAGAGAGLSDLGGDTLAYAALASLCAATLLALSVRSPLGADALSPNGP